MHSAFGVEETSSAKALRQECAGLLLRNRRESEYSEGGVSGRRRVREVGMDISCFLIQGFLTPNLFFKDFLLSGVQKALWQRWPL